jgi:hypothetical protein
MTPIVRFSMLIAALVLLASCSREEKQPLPADYSDQAEMAAFNELAQRLHLKFDKIAKSGAEGNGMGIRSDTLLFSRRTDSRTFFVQDQQHGVGRPNGIFEGSDDDLLRHAGEILDALGIPSAERSKPIVMQEQMREAQRDGSGNVTMGAIAKGRRIVNVTRQIDGLPVFSSHARMSLDKSGDIGSLEVHWPEVPNNILFEAHRLASKLKAGWKPPDQRYARVESMEAGIVHSGSLGTLMDIYPAIRVTYAPAGPGSIQGTKLLLYFDRAGRQLPAPRDLDVPCQPEAPRSAPPSGGEAPSPGETR